MADAIEQGLDRCLKDGVQLCDFKRCEYASLGGLFQRFDGFQTIDIGGCSRRPNLLIQLCESIRRMCIIIIIAFVHRPYRKGAETAMGVSLPREG